jgi:predicted RNA binding protein YcfA (HicA-like mRNA interferase family)
VGKLPKQTKRKDLIRRFRDLDWTGPHTGVGDHPEYMVKGDRTVKIPNQHGGGDIGEGLLKKVLAEAGISPNRWLGIPEDDEAAAEGETTVLVPAQRMPSNRRPSLRRRPRG